MENGQKDEVRGLKTKSWRLSYRTSSTLIDGRPLNMLHDFYIPLLQEAAAYDRVAGYFRSSSLAAASQGFSAFVGRGGKMRLIVGADLDTEDVRAILAGDEQRLARQLNGELEEPAKWPADVRNGVCLLAWMIAHGYLDVRVSFRVHGVTGDPLPFSAMEDGYVHEKWFVVRDAAGNRIYGSGTLNESMTALVLNAENIDLHCDWWGKTDCQRVEEAAAAFENLWQGQVPHMRVLTLPEAVRRRLVQLAEGIDFPPEVDGSSAAPRQIQPPSALERLRFAMIKDGPRLPGGRFVGMETAPVAPWPHQKIVARRLVESWPYSYLLCDEVGLGKTIEAGLAFRSLYLSGLAKRILIAAPAGLTQQWQRQMASKLLLSFGRALSGATPRHNYIFPVEEERVEALYEPDLSIVSTGLLARSERRAPLMEARPFDIALVDEAHAARRQNPTRGAGAHPVFGYLYTALRDGLRKKARSLWLATATPMQLDPVEPCDLLALTKRVGAFQFDPSLVLQYYEILARMIHAQEPSEYDWNFLQRAVQAVQIQDPMLWRFLDDSVVDGRIRAAMRQWLEHQRIPRGRDRELMQRILFSASPLSRVMLRHTRQLLEIYRKNGRLQENLARRHILPIPRIVFTGQEQRAYDRLEEYCVGLSKQISEHGDNQARTMIGFLLNFLRLRFASSLFALRETLRRRLRKVQATMEYQLRQETEDSLGESSMEEYLYEGDYEDDLLDKDLLLKNRREADLRWELEQLKVMLADLSDIAGSSSKMQYLLGVLDKRWDINNGRIRQTVVFTRFYDTLQDIVARLRQANPQILIGAYSGRGGEFFDRETGRMRSVEREEVKERFLRGDIDVLVCTDAAAEGLNLQTADWLINFDLGWNPMKVEQRIGRIDRIGQKNTDIYVLNLCYAGSAEDTVYGRLLQRLAEANLIVGTQQFSLLPVGPEDFQQLAEGLVTPEELEVRARERMVLQRERTERMEINPQDLYEIYMRMEQTREQTGGQPALPVDLRAIWDCLHNSEYLRNLGCVQSGAGDKSFLTAFGVDNVPDGSVLTVSRELYDQGLDDTNCVVSFASYGSPVFDAVLEKVGNFALPPCVQRISVPLPGIEAGTMIGYAAVEEAAGGVRKVRLIKAWHELEGLMLAENDTLEAAETEPLKKQLQKTAEEELMPYLAAGRIERDNVRAGLAQEMLAFLVMHSFIKGRARFAGKGALFWPVLEEIDNMFREREPIIADDLPADVVRAIVDDLLIDTREVPVVGDKVFLSVPRVFGKAALDAGRRLADSMKVKKSELGVETMLARLKREADERLRELRRL